MNDGGGHDYVSKNIQVQQLILLGQAITLLTVVFSRLISYKTMIPQ